MRPAITMAWVVIEIDEYGAIHINTNTDDPCPVAVVTTAYGPFATKIEAVAFADQYNAEKNAEKSSAGVIVRPMTEFTF